MERDIARTLALGMILLVSVVPLVPSSNRVTADPSIIDNGDGTSDVVWNFTNPSDYVFSATELVGNNVTLERQPTTWWNSTTQADFSGPDSETNIERNKWPGDVTMASMGGLGTLLTLQPGAAG